MPNWCSTTAIVCGDTNELNEFVGMVKECEKEQGIKNGFGQLWLGNLVNKCGEDWEKVYCRGSIIDYHLEENENITLYIEFAWSVPTEVFACIRRKFPNLDIWWVAEEPGCEVYCTNDVNEEYFPDNYVLNYQLPNAEDWETEYFENWDDVAKFFKEEFETEITNESDIDKLREEWEKEDEYAILNLNQFDRQAD